MKKLKYISLLAYAYALLVSTSATAAEDYYKWIDENGVPNYSDKIPVGYEGNKVDKSEDSNYKPSQTGAQTPNGASAEADASKKEDTKEKDAKTDAMASEETKKVEEEIAEIKRSNCEIGKRNLAQLQAYARIKVKEDDGKERVMGDDEKNAKVDEARKIIQENCSG